MKKIALFICIILVFMAFSIVATAEESTDNVETSYTVSSTCPDNPETEIDERLVAKRLVEIYDEQPEISFSLNSSTETPNRISIKVDSEYVLVYLSDKIVPKGADVAYSKNMLVYYFYRQPTRIYTYPCTLIINQQPVIGYFAEDYDNGFFQGYSIKEDGSILIDGLPSNETTNNPSSNVPVVENTSLSTMIQYAESMNQKVTIVYICMLVIVLLYGGMIALFFVNKYRFSKTIEELENKLEQNLKKH